MNWSQPPSQHERRGVGQHVGLLLKLFAPPEAYIFPSLGAKPSPPKSPHSKSLFCCSFWSHAFCFLFSTRETELGPQKNKARLPTGNVCSGGEFGGWRQAGQDPCQWNVIWGGSYRSLNCWQAAREQLDAFWAVCVHEDFFSPSCKQSPRDVETEALGTSRQGAGKPEVGG